MEEQILKLYQAAENGELRLIGKYETWGQAEDEADKQRQILSDAGITRFRSTFVVIDWLGNEEEI